MNRKKIIPVVILVLVLGFAAQHVFFPPKAPLTGTLELTEHSVGAVAAGRLDKIYFDDGSVVKKGQLLGTLDRYEEAKRDYDRALNLYKEGGADARSVETAKLTLEDEEILSPVDGVVLVKVREPGEILSPGAPVAVIGDRSALWVKVYVPEGVVNRVRMGQAARLHFDGLSKIYPGHVSYIAPQAEFTPRNVQTPEERMTRTFAVKVTLDEAEPFLRPGVAADIELDLGEKHA